MLTKQYVGLTQDKLIFMQNTEIKEMLRSVPSGASKKSISTWKSLQPLTVDLIVFNSP